MSEQRVLSAKEARRLEEDEHHAVIADMRQRVLKTPQHRGLELQENFPDLFCGMPLFPRARATTTNTRRYQNWKLMYECPIFSQSWTRLIPGLQDRCEQ